MSTPSTAARVIAANASLQAFLNCYLREVDTGTWYDAGSWQASSGVSLGQAESHVVVLELDSQSLTLAIGVRFRSLVGRHTLSALHARKRFHHEWRPVDGLSAQLLLIDAIYAGRPESPQRLELIARVVESQQTMARYVERALAPAQSEANGFLASEGSTVLGHWLHPTPKSRQGMVDWHHEHYTPELGGRFQLHYFAADRALVEQASLLDISAVELSCRLALHEADEHVSRRLTELSASHCILPVHPLQGQWLLHQDYVRELLEQGRLVDLGRLGPRFAATSSVRTLYSESADLMVKVSIPVKITNALRINLQTELGDSIWISQLLRSCGIAQAFPRLHTLEDPAYITLVLPEREETGFEVIFRSHPFGIASVPQHQDCVHAIAALVQDPLEPGHESRLTRLVRRLAASEELDLRQASLRWFDAYWECAIEPPIRIYDGFGIALEAHQQNVLLGFTPAGLPRLSYYRDLQGVGLSERFRDALTARVPELARQSKVFEPDDIVRNGLGYYLCFNQLYAVINRFALDGLLEEAELLGVVRRKLAALRPTLKTLGVELIRTLLEAKTIACKGNLLTRVDDMDELQADNELAVYTQIPNPLRQRAQPIRSSSSAKLSTHSS